MKQIDQTNIDQLLRGASLLACGGGLAFEAQKKLLGKPSVQKALKLGIKLISPDELSADDFCVTVSEVGAASAPVMDKSQLPMALALLEAKTGQKIKALIPGEIGQEAILLESAAILNLPIVDADLSGCRAVPRLTDLALVVRGIPFTMSPMVLMTDEGDLKFVDQQANLSDDEQLVRQHVEPGKVITMLGGMVSGEIVQKYLNYQSYSLAFSLGNALKLKTDLTRCLPTPLLQAPCNAQVVDIALNEQSGFDAKDIKLQTIKGSAILTVENEYMWLQLAGSKQHWQFPQLIMLLDPQKNRGLHSSEIIKGQSLQIMVADSFPFWKGKNES